MCNDKLTSRENNKKSFVHKEDFSSFLQFIKFYFYKPFVTGIVGFTLFLTITVFLDFIVHIFSAEKELHIEALTFIIAIVGFVLGFGYKFLEIHKK